MQSLPCTSTAGRFAAERERNRARTQNAIDRAVAMEALAAVLRSRPLRVITDFRPGNDCMPTLACSVRPDYAGLDQVYIDAHVRDGGWKRHPSRESRLSGTHDTRALIHKATGAELLLIITLPHGEVAQWEAA